MEAIMICIARSLFLRRVPVAVALSLRPRTKPHGTRYECSPA